MILGFWVVWIRFSSLEKFLWESGPNSRLQLSFRASGFAVRLEGLHKGSRSPEKKREREREGGASGAWKG